MAIQAGDKIPACTLKTMGSEGPGDITTDDIFSGKKVDVVPLAQRFYARL